MSLSRRSLLQLLTGGVALSVIGAESSATAAAKSAYNPNEGLFDPPANITRVFVLGNDFSFWNGGWSIPQSETGPHKMIIDPTQPRQGAMSPRDCIMACDFWKTRHSLYGDMVYDGDPTGVFANGFSRPAYTWQNEDPENNNKYFEIIGGAIDYEFPNEKYREKFIENIRARYSSIVRRAPNIIIVKVEPFDLKNRKIWVPHGDNHYRIYHQGKWDVYHMDAPEAQYSE